MTNTTTYLSPRNSSVMVDRTWAASLGLNQVPGARRVGNFYRLPRVAYLRALQDMREADTRAFEVPSLQAGSTQEAPVTARRSLSPCVAAAGLGSGSRRVTRVKAAA
jgi:hypothetical protein